jgi:hypothetical protein
VRRVNSNLFWCNAVLLLAALGLAGVPFFMGLGYTSDSCFFLYSAAPFAVLALWNLEKWMRRSREPESHPFLENIRSLGFGKLEAVDQDLNQAQDFLCLTLGRTWLLRRGFFQLELASLGDAVWAYRKESQSDYLMYFHIIVYLRSGKTITSEATPKAKKVDEFLSEISRFAPWIILGENDDLAKLWKNEKDTFVAQVDQRRKVLEFKGRESRIS